MKTTIEEKIYNAISVNSKSKSHNDFNILEYYLNNYGFPTTRNFNITKYDDSNIYDYENIIKELKKEFVDFKIIYEDFFYNCDFLNKTHQRNYIQIKQGYVIYIEVETYENIFGAANDKIKNVINNNFVLTPPLDNKFINYDVEDKLIKIFKNNFINIKNSSRISMVNVSDGELYAREYEITSNVKISNLDLHYGEGFNEFNNKLVSKIKKPGKGLVLLHGTPGTGKTYYLRYLLKLLAKTNKNILYFPPTMVELITNPEFLNFIASWSSESKNNLLLIEDAEPLLESRDKIRNIGITNLLNISDGILNDLYKIQIIATFNTELSKIDDALLRPERLIARKEFNNLSVENAKKLANKLKINTENIKKDMSLAEIYSMKNKNEILIHGMSEKRKIGFR